MRVCVNKKGIAMSTVIFRLFFQGGKVIFQFMPTYPRLVRIEALAKDQKLAANHLVNAEGLCACGRFLKKTDAKFLLGQVNSNLFPDPRGRNSLVIAGYCYECFTIINATLKLINNRHKSNEPDRKREIGV